MHPSLLPLFPILLLVYSGGFIGEAAMVVPGSKATLEHIDPTLPSVRPGQEPKCSVLVLRQEFANTVGSPPATANFSQPEECPYPWTRVVLELSVSASDIQKGRMAAVWIDGAEILRTSTPVPMAPGAFWRVEKDVTRYEALLLRLNSENGGAVAMMLENSNETLPGVYNANITLHFYRGALDDAREGYTAHPTVKGLYTQPANLIYPISQGCYGNGFWFRIDNESHVPATSIAIPRNTYRAVLEIFASHHADDEFWYTKPLRSAYSSNRANTHDSLRANGAFRQLYATIDGKFVGGHIPFAVIYPGTINPYFWSPVAAIGAFDIPSYDLDITPFLGMLIDGQLHEVGLGVRDANPHWLLTANLHLWIDSLSDSVEAGLSVYHAPPLKVHRHAEWHNEDGASDLNADGIDRFSGWVKSSKGNLTTTVRMKVKFRSKVEVQNHGAAKTVEMIHKAKSAVVVKRGFKIMGRSHMFVEAPLHLQSMSAPAVAGGVYERTRLTHQLKELVNVNAADQVVSSSALTDRQEAEGSALLHGGEPVWGSGSTKSSYKYRDAKECHLRMVNTEAGAVKFDVASRSCSAMAEA